VLSIIIIVDRTQLNKQLIAMVYAISGWGKLREIIPDRWDGGRRPCDDHHSLGGSEQAL